MADRTDHVLDLIDSALDDWSVSGDAMRWAPDPTPTQWLPACVLIDLDAIRAALEIRPVSTRYVLITTAEEPR